MQVEHKTEKGVILFVKVPEDASGYKLNEDCLYFDIKHGLGNELVGLPHIGFQLISLTTDITEEQAGMMLPKPYYESIYPDYNFITDRLRALNFFNNALDSFKSIIQHWELPEGKWVVLFKPNNCF